MSREFTIPLVLWACAALVAHAAIGGGAVTVTHIEEKKAKERAEIRDMVRDVRRGLGGVEIEIGDTTPWKPREEKPKESSPTLSALGKLGELVAATDSPEFQAEVEKIKKELEKKAPPQEEKPEEKLKEPEKKAEPEEKQPEAAKPMEVVAMPDDNRIKIRQAAQSEKDNPNAPRLAEHALSVEEETVAKARSNDTVSENPSLGSNQEGPKEKEGNSTSDVNGQAEDHAGDKRKAPGNAADRALAEKGRNAATGSEKASSAAAGGQAGQTPTSAATPAQAAAEGGRENAAHDHVHGEQSAWDLQEAAPGGDGSGNKAGFGQLAVPGARVAVPFRIPRAPGIGGGPGGEGTGFDLDWTQFASAVGQAELDQQQARIGASVRSQRKGRFDSEKFQRWLPDIENYDPAVKLGNQTKLNAAQSVFATYLSTIHNAIHPIFADEFLSSLNKLGKNHELNGDVVTHVEIILSKDEGRVVRMGITRNSGFTLFDAAALEAIDRAQPFGLVAPDAIVSPDGNVYLHWEFHRDPVDACSTRNASPFILAQPKPIKSNLPKRKPKRLKKPAKGEDGTAVEPGGETASPSTPTEPLVPRRKK